MEVVNITNKKVIGSFYGLTSGMDFVLAKDKNGKVQKIKLSCCIIRCDDSKRHLNERPYLM